MPQRYCLNCYFPLPEKAKHCPQCSQKYATGKIPLHDLWHEFVHTLFHFDTLFFRTLLFLFIPAKLTLEYFKGRHRRFAPPVRVFIVSGVICFAIVKLVVHPFEKSIEDGNRINRYTAERWLFLTDINEKKNALLKKYPQKNVSIAFDTLYKHILPKEYENLEAITQDEDSINTSEKKKQPAHYYEELEDSIGIFTFGFPALNLKTHTTSKDFMGNISRKDVFTMSEEELLEKYHVKPGLATFSFKQSIRFHKESSSLIHYFLSKSFWTMLLIMPFLAGVFKLLYIRRSRFFVEHLVFVFHYHSFFFITFPIALLISIYSNNGAMGWFFLILTLYLFLALKRYYQQGWVKTFFKMCIMTFLYMILFITFSAITLFISILLF